MRALFANSPAAPTLAEILPNFFPMEQSRLHYLWTWQLASAPDTLWPLVSDTDRFNRDCHYPPVEIVLSAPVREDPEMRAFLNGEHNMISLNTETAAVRGFAGETFALWRITTRAAAD